MSRIQCPSSRACAPDLASCVRRAVGRRHTPRAKPAPNSQREKPTDKESGFESCPSSPRADASVEAGHQCQCGAQTELRHQVGDCISLDCFSFIKKLGSGGYGSVVLVEKRTGRDRGSRYALKISSLSRAALVERDILPRLRGLPYTTDLAYAFFSAAPAKAFLALPYAVGKDLFSLAGPGKRPGYLRRMFVLSYAHYVDRVRIILAELSAALCALHEHRILYRDLKLENILVFGDGHIRLADFGLSRHFEAGESTLITGKTGTPDYMAPEVIRSSGAHGPATQYSFVSTRRNLSVPRAMRLPPPSPLLGLLPPPPPPPPGRGPDVLVSRCVIAYELIVGQLPFKGRELADLEHAILHEPVELPRAFVEEKLAALLSHERPLVLAALRLVKDLLQREPTARPTAASLPEHAFFRDLDWAAIASGRHDDPPFDIRRVVRELPTEVDKPRLPSAFSGVPSGKRERRDKGANSAYDNPAKYKNYHYCCSEFGWLDSDLEEALPADSRGVVPEDAEVDDDDAQWDSEPGTPLAEVAALLALPATSPASPDSACGDEFSASPASPAGYSSGEEWPPLSGPLPSHPLSPAPSEPSDASDAEAAAPPPPRTAAKRARSQRRLDFDLPPPPLPPFSSLRTPRPPPAEMH
ncbi:chromosomal serine/threonine-protein kinase JIL-1-like [Pollicipes pollicipes]|uniref:chromosomal serine/threonine-protein kinase JIL-1-like n=1 Tax=Pollicipes pollicipes TaxID=41117 RepID=UPI001884AB14|nr:chromosomal serine/threonine-protein kinase JIL-1-like [Pollicipes pollicipes]